MSSPRKRGPIITVADCSRRHLTTARNENPRRMGPCFRRDDMFLERLRVLALFFVVPANAGTHNPWRSRLQNLRRNTVFESKVLGVWVPACAGTTIGRARSQRIAIDSISNSHFATSRSGLWYAWRKAGGQYELDQMHRYEQAAYFCEHRKCDEHFLGRAREGIHHWISQWS